MAIGTEAVAEAAGGGAALGSAGVALDASGTAIATSTVTSVSLAAGAKAVAANLAAGYLVGQLFARGGSLANPDSQSFLGNGYSNLDPIPAVYGKRRIGGSRAVLGVRTFDDVANDLLLLVLIWGEGEFSALQTIYFDDEAASDVNGNPAGRLGFYANIRHHLGTDSQLADPLLVGSVADPSVWGTNCTLSGIAYTGLTLTWRPESFPNGKPLVTVDALGRKVFDPRTGLTAYSKNPAVVISDYLTNVRFGVGIPAASIDDTAIIDAANYCDQLVNIPNHKITALTLDAAGDGYSPGDVVILDGGVAASRGMVVVDTISGGIPGPVATWHILDAGSYTTDSTTFTQLSVTQHFDADGNAQYTGGSGLTFKNATLTALQQKRYTCDGVVNIEQSPLDNVRSLLSSCRGFITFTGGVYRLKIDKPAPENYLSLAGTAGSGATTGMSAGALPSGATDIEIVMKLGLSDYTPAANKVLLDIRGAGAVDPVRLFVDTAGSLRLVTSPDGAASVVSVSSASLVSVVADGADIWVKVFRDLNNGAAGNTTTSSYSLDEGKTWLPLGTAQTNAGITTLTAPTGTVVVGAEAAGLINGPAGKIYYGELRAGQDGIAAFKFDARFAPVSVSPVASTTGQSWTIVTDAVIAGTGVGMILSADNIIGGWSIQGGSKRTRFNRVTARYFNEDNGFLPDMVVQEDLTYRAQDGGLVLEGPALEIPFTTNVYRATQMTQIELKRSRVGLRVSLVGTIACTRLEIGDVVPLAHSTPGWPAATDPAQGKLFRVVEIELLFNDEVRLSLVEYNSTVYDLDPLVLVSAQPVTSLPDATTVPAPGAPSILETLYSTLDGGGVKSRATVTWGEAASVWVQHGGYYELEYRRTGAPEWVRQSLISATTFVIEDIEPAKYDFRVRAVNILLVRSAYSPIVLAEIFGVTAAPSDPTNFVVQAYEGKARFSWSRPAGLYDLDVLEGGRAMIRWSPLTVGADWNAGSLVNPDGYPGNSTTADGPLMTGTYLLKFKDGSGNYSANAASFVMTEALLTGLVTLATVIEHPGFAGLKTNTSAVDSGLQLSGVMLFDSISFVDSVGMLDSAGGVAASGSYRFNSKLDLGSVKNSRLFTTLRSTAFNTTDPIDSRTTNIDTWDLIDGAVIEDVDATLMVRTTNDDPDPALWMSMNATAGSGATTLDVTTFPTGDIEIIFKIGAVDYTPAATRAIFSKAPGAGTVNAVNLTIQASGVVRMVTSPNGVATVTADSTVGINTLVADGGDIMGKVYRKMDNGAVGNDTYFEYSLDLGATWLPLGTTVTNAGTTSIVDSTGLSQWGASANALATNNFDGKLHYGEVRNGREGPIVQKFDPTNDAEPGASNFVSRTGETYTIVSNAAITGPGAPTWGPWHALGFVADYNARGFDFRLDIVSADPTHNRRVDQLSVTAKQ